MTKIKKIPTIPNVDFSDHTVDVSFAERPPGVEEEGSRAQAYLVMLAGVEVGRMVKVDREISIGRGQSAGLRVDDKTVSKDHARLHIDADGEVVVEDLGSRNGTLVNGERIQRARLRDGDKISIGKATILKFSLADSLEEAFQKQMYHAALRDPLTSLFNRRHLTEQLAAEVSFAKRNKVELSVILLDIDHFKSINDHFGHQTGDAVLVRLGEMLRQTVRGEDFAARYGGEEFVIVCRGLDRDMSVRLAERLRQSVEAERMISEDPSQVVTISAGVGTLSDPGVESYEQLIAVADRALYQAKNSGRNKVCILSQTASGSL